MKNKQKRIFWIITAMLLVTFAGCASKTESEKIGSKDKRVTAAIECLKDDWSKWYRDMEIEDTYLKIINTRIINIKENSEDMFKDVNYIVEFSLLANHAGTSPYSFDPMQKNNIVVYKDGHAEVYNNFFHLYRATTYKNDFSEIIESIEDFEGTYDGVLKIE